MPTLQTFYITFPQKIPALAHCYTIIQDYNEEHARDTAFREFKNRWAFIYTEAEFAGQAEKYELVYVAHEEVREAIKTFDRSTKIHDDALYVAGVRKRN